ncbi:hypothetical protein EV2_019681 [Malus domestica]
MSQRCRLSHDARHGIPKVVDGAFNVLVHEIRNNEGDKGGARQGGIMSVMVHEMSARNLVHEGDKGDYAWHGWKDE